MLHFLGRASVADNARGCGVARGGRCVVDRGINTQFRASSVVSRRCAARIVNVAFVLGLHEAFNAIFATERRQGNFFRCRKF